MGKHFWYRYEDEFVREEAKRKGEAPPPITLYEETEQIVKEFQTPENPNGWASLWDATKDGNEWDFDSIEDAYAYYYSVHDRPKERLVW